jgi:hypothetical protein
MVFLTKKDVSSISNQKNSYYLVFFQTNDRLSLAVDKATAATVIGLLVFAA